MRQGRGAFTRVLHAHGWMQKGARHNNNSSVARQAKIGIRERVLEEIGEANASVFDAFAGEGELYRAVWRRARSYVGCDLEWYRDERLAFVTDNRRVMRAIDLRPFNIFDFDAWGSPWEQVAILCARRIISPGEKVGILITDGAGLTVKMGRIPYAFAAFARIDPKVPGVTNRKGQSEVMNRALNGVTNKLRARIVKRWDAAGKTAANLSYIGLVVEGLPAEIKKAAEPDEAAAA